ncbi:IS3 family transposase, partial [Patescibacteria group bacterium]|nr:IS3 family transposase [Patescibacteria group bacterium]
MIDKDHAKISLLRQTELLDVSRSSLYYQPRISPTEIRIMNAIDEIYTRYPFYGSRRIKLELEDEYQIYICREHVQRHMREMGLQAIYPRRKPNTSKPGKQHKKFPYLLKDIDILYPNQVWGTDITYIRLKTGFVYLVAIIDWFSRYIVSWGLSATLENDFCIQALKKALLKNIPWIHNSDQGVQFTSQDYISVLEEKEIRISMDGRGRCMDNIFTERLWRSVKYENVYLT